MGDVNVDSELAKAIVNHSEFVDINPEAHEGEHSIEIQLPFLQYVYDGRFRIYNLTGSGELIATGPSAHSRSKFDFIDNPDPNLPDYFITTDGDTEKVYLYYITDDTDPIYTFDGKWDCVSAYYGDESQTTYGVVLINTTHLRFYSLAEEVLPPTIVGPSDFSIYEGKKGYSII